MLAKLNYTTTSNSEPLVHAVTKHRSAHTVGFTCLSKISKCCYYNIITVVEQNWKTRTDKAMRSLQELRRPVLNNNRLWRPAQDPTVQQCLFFINLVHITRHRIVEPMTTPHILRDVLPMHV